MSSSATQSSGFPGKVSILQQFQQNQQVGSSFQPQGIHSLQLLQQQAFQAAQAGLIYPDWQSEDKSLKEKLFTILMKLDELDSDDVPVSVQKLTEMTQLVHEQYLIVQRRKEIHAQSNSLKKLHEDRLRTQQFLLSQVSQTASLASQVPTSLVGSLMTQPSPFQASLQWPELGVPTSPMSSFLTPSSSMVSSTASMTLPTSSPALTLSSAVSAMKSSAQGNFSASSPIDVRQRIGDLEIRALSLKDLLTSLETQFMSSKLKGDAREVEAIDKLVDIVLSSLEPKLKAKVGDIEFEINKKYFLGEKVANSVLVDSGVIHIVKAKLASAFAALSLSQEIMPMFLDFLRKLDPSSMNTLSSLAASSSLPSTRKRERTDEGSVSAGLLALSTAFSPPPRLAPMERGTSSTAATLSPPSQLQSISSQLPSVPTEAPIPSSIGPLSPTAALASESPIDIMNDPIFLEPTPTLQGFDLRATSEIGEDDFDLGKFSELDENDD